MTPAQEALQTGLGQQIGWRARSSSMTQILAPIFHEDGDMVDVFFDTRFGADPVRITDAGLTLMKLSYSFEVDTPNKLRLLERIVHENGIRMEEGELYLDASLQNLPAAFLKFTQAIARVSSLQLLKRQLVSSLFYEDLNHFVTMELGRFRPETQVAPLDGRPELEADFVFPFATRPVYLFGVRDSAKARLSVISCLEFKRTNLKFRSLIVHENADSLNRKDRRILMNTADKQFASLADFEQDAEEYLVREQAA